MNLLDQLKEKLGNKPINTIVNEAKKFQTDSSNARKEFIMMLFYLQKTYRYREYKTYQKETFETFIKNVFNLNKTAYFDERYAFTQFPEETKEFGPGLVNKVKKKCGGALAVPKVFQEIKEKQATRKKPLKLKDMEEIIEKRTKTVPKEKTSKPSYKELENEIILLNKALDDRNIEIKELTEQNRKLKISVQSYKEAISKKAFTLIKTPTDENFQNERRAEM